MSPEVFAPSIRHHMNGYTRRIGGNERTGPAIFLYFIKYLLFDIQALYHHFNDPVTSGNIFHIVDKIAGLDPRHNVLGIEG